MGFKSRQVRNSDAKLFTISDFLNLKVKCSNHNNTIHIKKQSYLE